MTTPRNAGTKKRTPDTSVSHPKKVAAKNITIPPSAISMEAMKAEEVSLVNSPYEIFAPLLELATTPWRMFSPFTPWPVKPMPQPKGKK